MRDKNLGLITEHQYQQELQKIEKDQKVKDRLQDVGLRTCCPLCQARRQSPWAPPPLHFIHRLPDKHPKVPHALAHTSPRWASLLGETMLFPC